MMKTIPFFRAFALVAAFSLGSIFAASLSEDASYEEILAAGKEANKPILLEFTGSDWCPPCKMMNEQVFSTPKFKEYAKDELIFVKLDFPRSIPQSEEVKARNAKLQKEFSVRGYPTVVLLNSSGTKVASNVGFMPGGPDALISWIQNSLK